METMTNIKAWKRKKQRIGLALIENNLHPTPTIGGIEIMHRHCGQNVIFTAWRDDKPTNRKSLIYRRGVPMTESNFYQINADDMNWLCQPD